MKEIYDFLETLRYNNDRLWFGEHKQWYLDVQAKFNLFAELLIKRISSFDSSVLGLTLKDCTYRIYRDIRFSSDKSPYKTHMGVYVCPGGKKTWHSGYYLHIEPDDSGYLNRSILVVGAYMPSPKMLLSIREDIYSRSEEFLSCIEKVKGFEFDESRSLKKMPLGFPKTSTMERYLRMKDFSMISPLSKNMIYGGMDELLDYAVEKFSSAKDFNSFINRAIDASNDL